VGVLLTVFVPAGVLTVVGFSTGLREVVGAKSLSELLELLPEGFDPPTGVGGVAGEI
jgi:hypothetical protein